MADISIKSLYRAQELPERAKVSGWVRTARESKNFAFIELNDGTFFKNLQIVCEEDKLSDYKELMRQIGVGASISVEGQISALQYAQESSHAGWLARLFR